MYVTCFMPSERVVNPKSDATTPDPADGVDAANTGGHAFAHAPEHTDLSPVSATHKYTARPEGPIKYVPSDPFVVEIAPPPDDDPDDPDAAGAADDEDDDEDEPHAATIKHTPNNPTTPPMTRKIFIIKLQTFDQTEHHPGPRPTPKPSPPDVLPSAPR